MMAHGNSTFWIGTSLGILKEVSVDNDSCLNYMPVGTDLRQMDRSRDILCMCRAGNKIYMALKNGFVQCFDCEKKYFCAECDLGGRGQFVGIARHEQSLITCDNEGVLSYWPDHGLQTSIDMGGNVCSMSTSIDVTTDDETTPTDNVIIATGGRENDLKIWDSTRTEATPIFRARNVPQDYLDLRVPIWVRAIKFIPNNQNLVVVATAYHQLRLYDTRAQRRPVYSHSWGDSPFTCMDVTQDGRYYVVGSSHGEICRVDVRKGDVINKYHGFSGSVKGICCYGNSEGVNLIGACGLDRYLRVYTMDHPTIVYKKYLKLFCNNLLVDVRVKSTDDLSKSMKQ